MKRFTQLPLTLYRIQPRLPVKLRSYDMQMASGRTSFDLRTHEGGLALPLRNIKTFETPNGMSLRPSSDTMQSILANFKGSPMVYTLQCGLMLPSDLVVFHEHTDHYSLQTAVPVPFDAFNQRLTEFLQSLPVQTREQFLEMLNDEDDQDN